MAKEKPTLPQGDLTLKQVQTHTQEMCEYFDWVKDSPFEKFFLMSEELGELAKEIRLYNNFYNPKGGERKADKSAMAHEFADVLSYLFDLASMCDVDLEQAYREKTEKNLKREWETE